MGNETAFRSRPRARVTMFSASRRCSVSARNGPLPLGVGRERALAAREPVCKFELVRALVRAAARRRLRGAAESMGQQRLAPRAARRCRRALVPRAVARQGASRTQNDVTGANRKVFFT